jgi:hypothetical protein
MGRKKKVEKKYRRPNGCGKEGVIVRRVVDINEVMSKQVEMIVDATGLDRVALYRYGVKLVINAYAAGQLNVEEIKAMEKPKGPEKKRPEGE